MKVLLGFVLLLLGLVSAAPSGRALFNVRGDNTQLVLELLERFDVWGRNAENGGFDVLANAKEFRAFMSERNEPFEFLRSDIDELIQQERNRLQKNVNAGWFEEYHDYNATMDWYKGLSSQFSQIATFVPSIGKTWEGRDIFAFRISGTQAADRKKAFIQCNIHAREWITNAVCQYVVDQLLTGYKSDPEITDLLNSVEFVFIPIVNPDGYSFTWTNDRMWRKNRRSNGGSYGVDLNRNYDQQWGGTGSSSSPASDTYRGPSPGSEPETKALCDYFNSLSNVIAAIDMHSYSQYILRPYTHTDVASPDESKMRQVSEEMADIIYGVHGLRYSPGIWFSRLYPSSGVAQDYYYVRGSYALTVELRPTSSFPGFILPPDEIIPTGEEIAPAVLHYVKFALANNNKF